MNNFMAMYKKPFTVDVKENLSDEFSAQVAERGYTKYRAIEGALRAFMALSPAEQVQWMSAGNSAQPQASQPPSQTIREVLKEIARKSKEQQGSDVELPGTVIRIEPSELTQIIKDLGPEPEQKKKARGG